MKTLLSLVFLCLHLERIKRKGIKAGEIRLLLSTAKIINKKYSHNNTLLFLWAFHTPGQMAEKNGLP